jgi:hypothetical protein
VRALFIEFEACCDECLLKATDGVEAGADTVGAGGAMEREHLSVPEQVDAGSDNDNLWSVVNSEFASRGPAREDGLAVGQGQFAERA